METTKFEQYFCDVKPSHCKQCKHELMLITFEEQTYFYIKKYYYYCRNCNKYGENPKDIYRNMKSKIYYKAEPSQYCNICINGLTHFYKYSNLGYCCCSKDDVKYFYCPYCDKYGEKTNFKRHVNSPQHYFTSQS